MFISYVFFWLSYFLSCVCHLVICVGNESELAEWISGFIPWNVLKICHLMAVVKLCKYICVYIFPPPHDSPPNSLAQLVTLVCIKSWLVHLMYCMRIFMISSILLGRCWDNAMNLATNISFPMFKFAEHNTWDTK